jgi:Protein of unknown function (DUF4054)
MTVTVASFRASLPEFANQGTYPSGVIQYWLTLASVLLGTGTGSPPKVCSFTGALTANGVITASAIGFGSLSLFPLLLEGNNLPNNATLTGQISGPPAGVGTYQCSVSGVIPAEPMVALQVGTNSGANPFWGSASLTADAPPTTVADIATQMWVAHQVVLEKQALAAAATGGDPGTKIGIISNKSVNGASMGFDVSVVAGGKMQENGGYYNQTIYGIRFYRLMKIRGAGPIQIGIGQAPPFALFNSFGFLGSSNAWGGPSPMFPQQGDVGF